MRILRAACLTFSILLAVALFACGEPAEHPAEAIETDPPAVSAAPDGETVSTQTEAPGSPEPIRTVEAYGQTIPVDLESLTIETPVGDLAPLYDLLPNLPACREVSLTLDCDPDRIGLAVFEQKWLGLKNDVPDVAFSGRLLVNGAPAETLETYAAPPVADVAAEIDAALRLCPALTALDLSETAVSAETVAAAAQKAPSVRFLWTDAAYGASASDAQTLAFSGEQDPETLSAYLACFPLLSEVDLRETTLTEEQAAVLCGRYPETAFRRMVLLNKIPTDNFSETLDFSDAKIADYQAFSDALAAFPKLTRLEMHECSLSNEQLAAIRDRYPNVKVVWTVRVRGWRIRTDAVAFSSRQMWDNNNRVTSKNADALRYCTDLIALDLGHNNLTDIEWIRPLKNLQVLILADNRKLKDISPLKDLKNLKYVELFLTSVSDVSPLADHGELLDVNLCWSKVTDVSPLLTCKKLERIWFGSKTAKDIGTAGINALKEAFPNAQFDLTSTSTSTGAGWREHPRYDAYIEMFKTNKPVDPFVP